MFPMSQALRKIACVYECEALSVILRFGHSNMVIRITSYHYEYDYTVFFGY